MEMITYLSAAPFTPNLELFDHFNLRRIVQGLAINYTSSCLINFMKLFFILFKSSNSLTIQKSFLNYIDNLNSF